MSMYTWEFGSDSGSLHFTVTYDTATSQFSITSLTGSFDLNALWFSDGDTLSDGYTLLKSDSSLNMNGTNTVWNDDGTSSGEKIVWDDYAKVSSTGLGTDGTDKLSFVSEGETVVFSLADLGLSSFDPEAFGTLGVRATSVNGGDSIKWVDDGAVVTDANQAPTAEPITWNVTEYDEHALANANPVYETLDLLSTASDADNDTLSVVAGSVTLANGDPLPPYLSVINGSTLQIDTNHADFDSVFLNQLLSVGLKYQITDGTDTIENTVALNITGTADQFHYTLDPEATITVSDNGDSSDPNAVPEVLDGTITLTLTGVDASAFDFTGTVDVSVTGDINKTNGGVYDQEWLLVAAEGNGSENLGPVQFGSSNNSEGTSSYTTDSGPLAFASADNQILVTYDATSEVAGFDITATISEFDYWQ